VPSNAPVAPALLALAGGIGQTLYESIRSFHYSDAAAQIIIVVATVIAIDLISAHSQGADLINSNFSSNVDTAAAVSEYPPA
jgi:hypothetical protein